METAEARIEAVTRRAVSKASIHGGRAALARKEHAGSEGVPPSSRARCPRPKLFHAAA